MWPDYLPCDPVKSQQSVVILLHTNDRRNPDTAGTETSCLTRSDSVCLKDCGVKTRSNTAECFLNRLFCLEIWFLNLKASTLRVFQRRSLDTLLMLRRHANAPRDLTHTISTREKEAFVFQNNSQMNTETGFASFLNESLKELNM